MNDNSYNRPPWWMTVVILVMLLPLFSWPMVIASLPEGESDNWKMLIYIFPIYAILSAYYAYRTFADRKELSIILLAVLFLSYLGVTFALLA